MKIITTLLFASAFVCALLAPPVLAQDDYSGKFKGSYVKREMLNVGDTTGHVLILSNSLASNVSTGKIPFMDEGEVDIREMADIVQGKGTYLGYIMFSKDGERTIDRLTGKVVTVMSPDGKTPLTTVEGTFEQIYGTNMYGAVKPAGLFKTRLLSPSEYETEWVVTKLN